MQKLHSIAAILNAVMPSDLKSYLVQKMKNIEKTYHCDTGDSLSVILLEKQEESYLLDKGLEFYEILSFSHADWIHTVWASSDGYSEDPVSMGKGKNLIEFQTFVEQIGFLLLF